MRLHSVILGLCAAGLYVFHPVDVQHFSLEGKPDPRFVPETPGKAAPFIAVSVADLDRQLKWYRDNLGFEVHSQGTVPGKGIKFALLKKEGALVELLQIPESRPRPGKPRDPSSASLTQGFFKSGMVVADVDALQARLEKNGADFAFKLATPPAVRIGSSGFSIPREISFSSSEIESLILECDGAAPGF